MNRADGSKSLGSCKALNEASSRMLDLPDRRGALIRVQNSPLEVTHHVAGWVVVAHPDFTAVAP